MYILIVVLMLDSKYEVKAPNIVFTEQGDCLGFKQFNEDQLRKSRAADPELGLNAKFFATCVKIPKDFDVGT